MADQATDRIWADALLDAAFDAVIIMDSSGRITHFNAAAERIFGYSRDEVTGRLLGEVIVPPALREAHWRGLRRLVETGESRLLGRRIEITAMRADGTQFPVELAITRLQQPGPPVFLGYVRDITGQQTALLRRLRTEEAARAAIARAETIGEATSATLEAVGRNLGWAVAQFWQADDATRVLRRTAFWVNPEWASRLDEWLRADVLSIGADLAGVVAETRRAVWIADLQPESNFPRLARAAARGLRGAFALPVLVSGRVVGVMEFLSATREPENPQLLSTLEGLCAMFGYFIEHLSARETEQALLADAQDARDTAEAANRAKDEFLAVVSHELRSPMTPIVGWARILKNTTLTDKQRRAVDAIDRSAFALTQLVDDLLDVSRIIVGNMPLELEPVDPARCTLAAIDTVRPSAQAKGVELTSRLDDDAGPVAADPRRLQQIVWNLLVNAVKFTPSGGHIAVTVSRADDGVELSVADTGVGIDPRFLPFVFDRFRQGDASATREHGGLGIGLAIVRHLVERHGGRVSAHSKGTGRGATFKVWLPPWSRAPAVERAAPLDHVPTLAGVGILAVDDDADTRDVVREILSSAGASVRTAASAAEALAELEAWRPDLLLVDLAMPEQDGASLVQEIRERRTPDSQTPAIALTAYSDDAHRTRALAAGFADVLTKPVDPARLVKASAKLLGRS